VARSGAVGGDGSGNRVNGGRGAGSVWSRRGDREQRRLAKGGRKESREGKKEKRKEMGKIRKKKIRRKGKGK
jgi:hypothetical protein